MRSGGPRPAREGKKIKGKKGEGQKNLSRWIVAVEVTMSFGGKVTSLIRQRDNADLRSILSASDLTPNFCPVPRGTVFKYDVNGSLAFTMFPEPLPMVVCSHWSRQPPSLLPGYRPGSPWIKSNFVDASIPRGGNRYSKTDQVQSSPPLHSTVPTP